MGRTLTLHVTIQATSESTFAALTDSAELSRWFTESHQADLRVGGRYRNSDGDAGEFLALEPPHRLEFTWEKARHCRGVEHPSGRPGPREGHAGALASSDGGR